MKIGEEKTEMNENWKLSLLAFPFLLYLIVTWFSKGLLANLEGSMHREPLAAL